MMSDSKAASADSAPGPPNETRLRIDPRYLSSGLITLILVFGQVYVGFLHDLSQLFTAIAVALAAELALGRLLTGKWLNPASAYITGISCGILLRSLSLWPFAVASLLSIMSKYVLRFRGRHLWNPSNLGICVVLFAAPGIVAALSEQWGNDLWAMTVIWLLGSVILWRAKRFPRHADLRGFLCRAGLRAIPDDRGTFSFRGRAHYWPHVPANGVLHGHGSRYNRLNAQRTDRNRLPRGAGGDGAPAVRDRQRAAVCPVPGGTGG